MCLYSEYLIFSFHPLTSAVSLGFGDTLCWLKAAIEGHVPLVRSQPTLHSLQVAAKSQTSHPHYPCLCHKGPKEGAWALNSALTTFGNQSISEMQTNSSVLVPPVLTSTHLERKPKKSKVIWPMALDLLLKDGMMIQGCKSPSHFPFYRVFFTTVFMGGEQRDFLLFSWIKVLMISFPGESSRNSRARKIEKILLS